jgi:hypothetical protein
MSPIELKRTARTFGDRFESGTPRSYSVNGEG